MTQLIDELAPDDGADLEAVVEAIRDHDRFLVTTHENPDGDALGSLLAMTLALTQLGKDAVMYLAATRRFRASTPSWRSTSCAASCRATPPSASSSPSTARTRAASGPTRRCSSTAPLVLDIDHHHDNTRFGDVNLSSPTRPRPARCCATSSAPLGVEFTPEIAEALYIAVVTDTGRFQYTNTTPKALRLAAELVEAGADVHRIFQGVYESVQFAKLKLLARALERAQVYEGGRLVVSHLLRDDFREVGAAEPYSEGIIDYLRAVEGAEMAALIREPPRVDGPPRRVSLRASRGRARRVGDRAQVGRRRAPAGGRLLERADRSRRSRIRGARVRRRRDGERRPPEAERAADEAVTGIA